MIERWIKNTPLYAFLKEKEKQGKHAKYKSTQDENLVSYRPEEREKVKRYG